ncbi:MAG: hypothetical protein WDO74_02450 [Pseudomonadota bacterium]
MLLRRLPTFALLASLPLLLAHCSSDTSPVTSAGGQPSSAGSSGSPSAAGQPSIGGGGATAVAGGGSTSVAGGGAGGSVAGSGGTSAGGGGAGGASSAGAAGKAGGGSGGSTSGSTFTLASTDHMEGAKFDGKFTCNGGALMTGVIPELHWTVPAGTMSFAITFIDTTIGDTSPMGQHWAIWNIPATVTQIMQGTKTLTGDLAMAKQSGSFFAPCAQSLKDNMDDQYAFTIYALPTATLNVTGMSVANALTALKAVTPKPPTAVLTGHSGLKGK